MKRLLKGAISTLLIGLMSIQLFGMNVLAEEIPTIKVPVKVSVTGDYPYNAETFDVILSAEDSRYPMPEGSVEGTYTLNVNGGASAHFPEISYPELGVYEYTIHQEKGHYSRGNYDNHVYNMKVFVTNAEQGGFESTTILYIDDINTKYKEVKFVNSYDPRKEDPTDPTTPTSAPEPTTTPIPTTEMPTDVIEDVEEAFDPFGVLGAFNENYPFGVLGATGDETPIVPILAVMAACAGIVVFVMVKRKKKSYEE